MSDAQAHIRALHAALSDAHSRTSVQIRLLETQFPELRPLLRTLTHAAFLADPTTSPPIGNSMRITHPDSTIDHGKRTRSHREHVEQIRYDLTDITQRIAELIDEPHRASKQERAAHKRWHVNRQQPSPGCVLCAQDPLSFIPK